MPELWRNISAFIAKYLANIVFPAIIYWTQSFSSFYNYSMIPEDGDYNQHAFTTNIPLILHENREQIRYPLHWHTAIEIIMPLELSFKTVLNNKSYNLRKNDILIVPPCELHSISVPKGSEAGRRIILLFEPVLLYSLSNLSRIVSNLYNFIIITPEGMPTVHEKVSSLLLASYKEKETDDDFSIASIYANLIEIFILLSRYYNNLKIANWEERPNKRSVYIDKINTVFEYIDTHIAEEIHLEKAAEIVCFSKYHFEHIFREYTNQSFNQYLNQRRIYKAIMLLLNPNLSITDVAMGSGFSCISSFNRVFKKIKNCTPSEYKKLHMMGI